MAKKNKKRLGVSGGLNQEQKSTKNQTKQQNKILKGFLIGMILILFIIFLIVFISNRVTNFEYRGVEVQIVKFCDKPPCLITYNTKIPVIYQGKKANYNFYLRNDPRELEKKVPFNGNLELKDNLVMNITFNRYCKGEESVAVSNFATLYNIAGVNINSNSSLGCSASGEYMHISLRESNKTNIEQTGPACYAINIKECEIIDGMERFMTETFVEINEKLREETNLSE